MNRKHLRKLQDFLRDMEKRGYLMQIATRIDTREPVYVITEKGKRIGVQKRIKGMI